MLTMETPPLDQLPQTRNSRTHSDEQIAQIAASIAEFGFVNLVQIASEATATHRDHAISRNCL